MPLTHLYVWQSHDPRPKLSREAQGVQRYEDRVPKPVQQWGAHPRDAEGVERISGAAGGGGHVHQQRPTVRFRGKADARG